MYAESLQVLFRTSAHRTEEWVEGYGDTLSDSVETSPREHVYLINTRFCGDCAFVWEKSSTFAVEN